MLQNAWKYTVHDCSAPPPDGFSPVLLGVCGLANEDHRTRHLRLLGNEGGGVAPGAWPSGAGPGGQAPGRGESGGRGQGSRVSGDLRGQAPWSSAGHSVCSFQGVGPPPPRRFGWYPRGSTAPSRRQRPAWWWVARDSPGRPASCRGKSGLLGRMRTAGGQGQGQG